MVHVSLPYFSVLKTQALYTTILVFSVNLGLVHTREVRRASVVAAFPNPLINLCVQGEVVSDGGAKIFELFNDIELIVIDNDDWQFRCILSQDFGFLETGDYSEILAGLRERLISVCSSCWVWVVTAASSANSMSLMRAS